MPAHQGEEPLDERMSRSLQLDEETGDQQEFEDDGVEDGEDDGEDAAYDSEGRVDGYPDDDPEYNLRHSPSSLSYDPIDGPASYAESAEIMSKKYLERDQVKLAMEQQERMKRLQKIRARRQHIDRWQQKTAKSPFHVNLVAETERLDEEHRLRAVENARRAKELDKRARQAKNEVILKALTETSDLELLRREKRAIIEEEKRLKALMDLEKTNSHRKMDLIAAKNAEKKRRQEKESYRRSLRQQEIEERELKYKELLKEKLAIGEAQ